MDNQTFLTQLIPFLKEHLLLTGALAFLLITIAITEYIRWKKSIPAVSPTTLTQLMNHEKGIVVDIRDAEAFKRGHIRGAVQGNSKELVALLTKLKTEKDQPIILVCGSGQSASRAGTPLRTEGFSQVSYLEGGVSAWQAAHLPLTAARK